MFFFVSRLFEILPETKAIFHYDENDSNSLTKLRNHIKLLFDTIGMAVDFIDDLGSLTPVIIQLGTYFCPLFLFLFFRHIFTTSDYPFDYPSDYPFGIFNLSFL
jgi:hypothetical protein